MLTNYYTLSYVVSSLDSRITGLTVEATFSQERDHLVFSFGRTTPALVVSCAAAENALYLHPAFSRSKRNSADVLKDIWGKRVKSVLMHPSDRVVTLELDAAARVDIQLFGAKANVLLVDVEGVIVDAFKRARELVGSKVESRTNKLFYDTTLLDASLIGDPSASIVSALKKLYPTLGTTLVKEVLHRSQVPSTRGVSEIDQEILGRIKRALRQVMIELASPDPRVYIQDGGKVETPVAFSIVQLDHLEHATDKRFDDVHEAIRFYISRERATSAVSQKKNAMLTKLRLQRDRALRSMRAAESDLQGSTRAEEYESFGSLLMTNLGAVERGAKKARLDNADIPLEPHLSPVQNAQRYFEKAKKSRAARQDASDRLKELRASATLAGALVESFVEAQTKEEIQEFVAQHESELEGFGIGKKAEERAQLPFRTFVVDGGFQVWAGKSSANNDLLTMKHAAPNDLWFHARGSSGSHVVLKVRSGKGEPGKRAKEQAAGIAAYYSRMKNAKMVPVAMTERKYVRKPKGAPAGTVVIEREKVIFAEPALPKP